MIDERERLRESSRRILEADPRLRDQLELLKSLAGVPELQPTLESIQQRVGALESVGPDSALALETIVNRVGRPVLEVADDDYLVEGPEAAVWEARLSNATVHAALKRVIPSVGRIEVDNNPDFTWVGTGWLIADDVVVTNRHVAEEFAALSISAGGVRAFVFKRGWPDRTTRMAARVDFKRELRNNNPRPFAVKEVLHIEDDDGPDFAFLRVEKTGAAGTLSPSLHAATDPAEAQQYVATIGYPASDSRIPEQELMTRLFGDKYNVKRLAPGQVMRLGDDLVMHDCSTLGGNSGSPIIDLATGDVLGLHFSGVFLKENRGVPIGYVLSRLQKRPTPTPPAAPAPVSENQSPPPAAAKADGNTVTVTIPLQITVSLGTPTAGGTLTANVTSAVAAPAQAPPKTVAEAVGEARDRLKERKDILTVRDGYAFRNGWITPDPAVVVVLKDRGEASHEELGLPTKLGGFPVELRVADPWDIAESQGKLETLEGFPRTTYKPPPGLKLTPVQERMTVTCHVSPDAGWPVLREFLQGTKTRLQAGVYNFTAPHIIDGVSDAVKGERKLSLVMQAGESMMGKPDDIPEHDTVKRYQKEMGDRFDFAWASVGKDHQFASAYHIKVAVRDGKAFWLSSGNWQSSNQPDHGLAAGETSWDLLLQHNRDWHVVIENANLAKQFEGYLQYDLKNAKADSGEEGPVPETAFFLVNEAVEERPTGKPTYFAPLKISREVKVRPLLTPDNYQEHVLELIESAERRLLFQNQSLSLLAEGKNDAKFEALVDALLAKQKAGVDVRIIIRGEFAPVRPLEQLRKKGFDMGKVRLQNRCHTKGIVVDGARVLIGSQNWTNQGTVINRDASLIFDDEEIAKYYEDIFFFDWKSMSRQSAGGRRVRAAPSGGENEAVAGTRRVSWQEIVNG